MCQKHSLGGGLLRAGGRGRGDAVGIAEYGTIICYAATPLQRANVRINSFVHGIPVIHAERYLEKTSPPPGRRAFIFLSVSPLSHSVQA